jgi:hypothetical protein
VLKYRWAKTGKPNSTPPLAVHAGGSQPGPKPSVRLAIADKMLAGLRCGHCTPEQLESDTLAALVVTYGGSPNTANRARQDALAAFSNKQI